MFFEAPDKPSQFALLDHFGPEVHLCNVRLEELLRERGAETFRLAKPTFSRPAPSEVVERIALHADLAVEALAD